MQDDNEFSPDLTGRGKQPWFGPKRFGIGYGPRTWQGYLITGVMAVMVVTVGSVAGAHSPWFLAAIAVFAVVHIAIIAIQRR
jgi:hypothetical protein